MARKTNKRETGYRVRGPASRCEACNVLVDLGHGAGCPKAKPEAQVVVVKVGRDDDTTRIEVRVRGEWSRAAAAVTFRLAARLSEETPASHGWALYTTPSDLMVVMELCGERGEVAAALATADRVLGGNGRPNPSAPNMSTLYTVKA